MRTPKNWSRVSPGNLARVSNLWPGFCPKISLDTDHHLHKHQQCRHVLLKFPESVELVAGARKGPTSLVKKDLPVDAPLWVKVSG